MTDDTHWFIITEHYVLNGDVCEWYQKLQQRLRTLREILREGMMLLTPGSVAMISDSLCFRAPKKLRQWFFMLFPLFIGLSFHQTPKSCKKPYRQGCSSRLNIDLFCASTHKPEIQEAVCLSKSRKVFWFWKHLARHQRLLITSTFSGRIQRQRWSGGRWMFVRLSDERRRRNEARSIAASTRLLIAVSHRG